MKRKNLKVLNRGRKYRRTEYVDPFNPDAINLEKVFADSWEEENVPEPCFGFGYGILQDLFCEGELPFNLLQGRATHIINPRERMIVATVIQWLGSNVGFCWLQETLKKGGYEVKRIKKDGF